MISNVAEYYFPWYHLTFKYRSIRIGCKKTQKCQISVLHHAMLKIRAVGKDWERILRLTSDTDRVLCPRDVRHPIRYTKIWRTAKSNLRCLWYSQTLWTLTIQRGWSSPVSIQGGESKREKGLNMTSLYFVRFVTGFVHGLCIMVAWENRVSIFMSFISHLARI